MESDPLALPGLAALQASLESSLAAGLALKQDRANAGLVLAGVSSVPVNETLTSTTYDLLDTPDQVANVVVPASGLAFVYFRGLFKLDAALGPGAVALFIGANQLKNVSTNGSTPGVVEGIMNSDSAFYGPMGTQVGGGDAIHAAGSDGSDSVSVGAGAVWLAGSALSLLPIEVDPGTYTISVRYKVTDGTLNAKERKLVVWVPGA